MEKKDYFSRQSHTYAAFRPTYPEALYEFVFKHLKRTRYAWDCATGNGQVARRLASHFEEVWATDISPQQLHNAFPMQNILYSVSAAEQTLLPDRHFDLITVAQALHWIDVAPFYQEVRRTAAPGALLAVWGYTLPTINTQIDDLLLAYYNNTVGAYWDPARRLVENRYRDIPFPFDKIECPPFSICVDWTRDQFTGYLTSWSATQQFMLDNGTDPVSSIHDALEAAWKSAARRKVTFPVFMMMGRV